MKKNKKGLNPVQAQAPKYNNNVDCSIEQQCQRHLKSFWKPPQFTDLGSASTITIFVGPNAWNAAEQLSKLNVSNMLMSATGNDDPLAIIDGDMNSQPPLVVGDKLLADTSALKRARLADQSTRYVYLELHGPVSASSIRELISVIATQAPNSEIFQDGQSVRQLMEVMDQAGIINKHAVSAADLKMMGASEKADLLLARYSGELALDDASDDFFTYSGTNWKPIHDKVLRRELAKLYREANAAYSAGGIVSVIDTMRLSVPVMEAPSRELIGFKNGVFDMVSRTFRGHSKTDWLTNSLDVDYAEAVAEECIRKEAPNFSQWLNRVARGTGTAKSDRILAALFMVLANRYDWQLFLEITGPGGSGKSVFAEICTMLAGANNTTSATIDSIENARERSALVGYSLAILPDQPRYMGDGAGLKAITGGDSVMVDPKHKPPYSTRIPAVILAVNNNPMAFSDRSGGISRRRVIFNFSEAVPEEERDTQLITKITKELPVIIRHLLSHFSLPEGAKEQLLAQQKSAEALEIKREADSLVDFCSYLIASSQADGLYVGNANITPMAPRRFLYHAYLTYMAGMAHQRPLSLTAFGKAMPYAMAEFGARYIKARTKHGMRTNLGLNEDTTVDWIFTASGG